MHSLRKFRIPSGAGLLAALLFLTVSGSCLAQAAETGAAVAPKPLIDLTSPDAIKQIKPNYGDPVYTVDTTGITVKLPAARANYPGIQISPATGDTWDLSPYGHIEAKITNTGGKPIRFTMALNGVSKGAPTQNTEIIGVKPGESKVLKVIFGYAWGYHPTAAIESAKVGKLILFLAKTTEDQSFRIEGLQAAGAVGEQPPFSPDAVVAIPKNGVILGQGVTFDPAKQVIANGAKVAAGPNGALAVNFAGGKTETIKIKPAMGVWNLTQANQIRVTFKNLGDTPATPAVAIGPNTVPVKTPLAPGAEAEIALSFIPEVSGVGIGAKDIKVGINGVLPGTGTDLESEKVKEFSILSDATPGAKSLLITSIIADVALADLPAWLGKRPPVEGDWVQTFTEEFDGPAVDYSKWNIYARNFWDKRTHFSKDNLILKDGKAILRYEKKTGFHNDDPTDKETVGQTDYACGFLNTYGKWTQRYGYFESRVKLPTAPGLWPAFWLMPDRGKGSSYKGHYRVGTALQPGVDTGNGGMEFDIVESLSGWGPYRYNIAMLWDGYGKGGKQLGSTKIYIRPDKEGYITSGLLWTPGSAIYYCNGKEVLRWENERISDLQEYIMFDVVTGGWDKTLPQIDDAKLPEDFIIDYVRVWQRKDLATPEDGPKPNKADPRETKN